ncbi:DEAD-box ATP-dependent RNA helicase 21-like [Telopea speciosissima]|uniref:DEAD-box ATP-dependent RNA helicase 21-like n=1 Tax=Telopea speciosissima TaxID=54955 RepID=UPI001CC7341E|nr:DEAD-box ATP-dependent RNA helicase 21-like [Telopea speciosissima]
MDQHGNPVLNLPTDPMVAMLELFQKLVAEQRAAIEAQKATADAIMTRLQQLEEQRVTPDRESNLPIDEDRYQLNSVVQRLPDRDGDPRDDYRGHRDGSRDHRDRLRDDRNHYRDCRDKTRGIREPSREYKDRHRGYKDRDREEQDRNRGRQPTFEEYMRSYFTGDQGPNRCHTDNQKVKLELIEFDGDHDPQEKGLIAKDCPHKKKTINVAAKEEAHDDDDEEEGLEAYPADDDVAKDYEGLDNDTRGIHVMIQEAATQPEVQPSLPIKEPAAYLQVRATC